MRVFALGFLMSIILLFVGRFAKISDEARGAVNRIAYYTNLFLSLNIIIHELWRNRDETSRASMTSIIATGLVIVMGVVVSLNIAHKEQKDVMFGLSLSVSVIGFFISLDIESYFSFGRFGV